MFDARTIMFGIVKAKRLMHQTGQRSSVLRYLKIGVPYLTAAVLLIALLAPRSKIDSGDKLPQLQANQVLDDYGEFRFPSGNRVLKLFEDDNGNVHIEVHVVSCIVWCIPLTDIPYRSTSWNYVEKRYIVESKRDWFVSVDKYDRLWVYAGRWMISGENLHGLTDGGANDSAPTVTVYGLGFLRTGGLARSDQVAIASDDWIGVPRQFHARVLKESESDGDVKWAVPERPPAFTSQQAAELTRRLNLEQGL